MQNSSSKMESYLKTVGVIGICVVLNLMGTQRLLEIQSAKKSSEIGTPVLANKEILAKAPSFAEALISGPELLSRLRKGGLLVFVRHFHTTVEAERNDLRNTEHAKLSLVDFQDCGWQRVLSEYGRQRARAVGAALAKLKVGAGEVFSSPYCRASESAKLIFSRDAKMSLSLLYAKASYTREKLDSFFKELLSEPITAGQNSYVVLHKDAFDFLAGIVEGEAVVLERFVNAPPKVIARIKPHEWTESLTNPELLGLEAASGYKSADK